MKKSIAWLLFYNVLLVQQVCASGKLDSTPEAADIIGHAYDLSGQTLLYTEHHYISSNTFDHKVIYRDPVGAIFSTKNIDYRTHLEAPSFTISNLWSNETISVDNQTDALLINYHNSKKGISSQQQLSYQNDTVVDAGFHPYIKHRWQSLLGGNKHDFKFLITHRFDLINLNIKKVDCEQPLDQTVCFRIGASNPIISWLIGRLELEYHQQTQQLQRFKGLGNINNREGKGLKVDIRYQAPLQIAD